MNWRPFFSIQKSTYWIPVITVVHDDIDTFVYEVKNSN